MMKLKPIVTFVMAYSTVYKGIEMNITKGNDCSNRVYQPFQILTMESQ